ncbi:hypothetical protein JW960_05405 [candidate division KSB1 bacterium]|nr:hypothetical protein [candidate division KSB1 bacterium]
MLDIFFSSAFFNSVHQLVEQIIRISTYIFTLGVVIYFISMIFRLSTDTEGRDFVYHLFLVGFSAIGLATYRIWAIYLGKLFVLLARAIFDIESGNIMTEYLSAFFGNSNGTGLQLSLFNLMSLETLSSLSYFLVMVVYEVFVVIQVIVQIFFYMIGPLAIVLSLFPTIRDTFKVWIVNFCAVNFWSVLIAILFRLVQTFINSQDFKQALQAGEKSMLWESFMLGIILSVVIVLIPKLSLAIFKGGTAAADVGSYGTGITAGVMVSTIWKRMKMLSITATQQLATHTSTGIITGAQAMSKSPTALSTEAALRPLTTGSEGSRDVWPFDGAAIQAGNGGDIDNF